MFTKSPSLWRSDSALDQLHFTGLDVGSAPRPF